MREAITSTNEVDFQQDKAASAETTEIERRAVSSISDQVDECEDRGEDHEVRDECSPKASNQDKTQVSLSITVYERNY